MKLIAGMPVLLAAAPALVRLLSFPKEPVIRIEDATGRPSTTGKAAAGSEA